MEWIDLDRRLGADPERRAGECGSKGKAGSSEKLEGPPRTT